MVDIEVQSMKYGRNLEFMITYSSSEPDLDNYSDLKLYVLYKNLIKN